ncbi:uracil-DNA glycosylase [Leptospira sp. GIMC2001]|uniref:uracil-DNA glycosylase n=1 Tax=Leptospira sp. GIMC2001 TaxID=1513297 RepID=UPI00234AB5AC|nr:uracil-DNA glycosylase [Leptospira sp. GIMC2001]WCL50365.1 uracil-DNA glycosylase [Leptospira sp. GIMC2001]
MENSWKNILGDEFTKPYFLELTEFVKTEYKNFRIFPKASQIFRALDSLPVQKVRVVILGQDPYHGTDQANGLCFSVNPNVQVPPSLLNIYKEIKNELLTAGEQNVTIPKSGDLSHWVEQGILLLNATLTVRENQAGSHQNKGWEKFTDRVIELLSQERSGLVFLLWGAYAQKKGMVIDTSKHLVLKSPHPSPLSASRGFMGNGHFLATNEYLVSKGEKPIKWFE